jgi:hypothetical protein
MSGTSRHQIMEKAQPRHRKGIKSIFILVCWGIWKEPELAYFQEQAFAEVDHHRLY